MAPTACGSAAILIDSTECRCTLVCPNSKRRPFSTEGKPAVGGTPAGLPLFFPYAARLQCSMPPCSCLFQQQAPSTPPRRGANPPAGDTPPRGPPAARAAREPSGRATRGRTPPGGAASPRAAAGRCAALCGAGGTGRSGAGLLRRRGKAARGRAEPKKTEIKFLCGMQARSGKPNTVSSPVRQKSSCAVRRCGAESGRRRAETDG